MSSQRREVTKGKTAVPPRLHLNPATLKTLASQIERELHVGERKHCVVYERELKRLWSLDGKDREAKITQFAKKYGFRLRLYKKGLCAIFDKWPRATAKLVGKRQEQIATKHNPPETN